MLRRTVVSYGLLGTFLRAGAAPLAAPQPEKLVLQDPLPGQALIYLVRAPRDSEGIVVLVDEAKAATLPSSTYTAISLSPGQHRLGSATASGAEPSIEIDLKADERRFFYLSALQQRPLGSVSNAVPLLGPISALVDGTVNRSGPVEGTRSWKECEELDARDLMLIAALVLPD